MYKIVGIGANVYDMLITLPYYPAEDTKLRAVEMQEAGGGPCATGLAAAAVLGESCAYIGALADDAGGRFLKADLERYGVSTQFVTIQAGKQSFSSYIWLSEASATRTCVFLKTNLPVFTLGQAAIDAIQSAEILMVDGNELPLAVEGAKIARQSGTKVLYDAGGLYDGIEELLPLADILIPSEEFALGHTGADTVEEAAKQLFVRYRPEVIVITCGKKGGILYDGKSLKRYPAFSVRAKDTNGAGDVFHGAFAFGVTRGYSYEKTCVFASAVSALKCTKVGARSGVPDFDTVTKFLKECGRDEFEKELEK